MPIDIQTKDLLWTADGDLYLDPDGDGDIYVATEIGDEILSSAIIKRLASTEGDWQTVPSLGANLSDFMGLPNTAETAAYLHSRILNTLTQDLLIRSADITLQIVPIGPHELLVVLLVKAIAASEPAVIGFSFDMRDNKMIPRIINV